MSDSDRADAPRARGLAVLVYALQALTLFFGFPLLLALAVNLLARDAVRGTLYESHFHWQLVTTQWALALGVPGAVLFALGPAVHESFVPLGSLLLVVASFWLIYRALRGFMFWTERQPAPGGQRPGAAR